jgi:hypothetical protein
MITGYYIKVDDENVYTIGEFTCEAKNVLETIQGHVDGWIEAIPTADTITIWVNEEGKIHGKPHNIAADMVWAAFDKWNCLAAGDWIAGNAVITGPPNRTGRTTSAPANTLDLIRALTEGFEFHADIV